MVGKGRITSERGKETAMVPSTVLQKVRQLELLAVNTYRSLMRGLMTGSITVQVGI